MTLAQSSIGLLLEKSKRVINQSLIHRVLLKVKQVIYTLDTICDSNIMTLAQAVLEIFQDTISKGSLPRASVTDRRTDPNQYASLSSSKLGHTNTDL